MPPGLTIPQSAAEQFEREFLQIRARLLEMAAALDRIQRAELQASAEQGTGASPNGLLSDDPRRQAIDEALAALSRRSPDRPAPDRAEQIQRIFSRLYDPAWQSAWGLKR